MTDVDKMAATDSDGHEPEWFVTSLAAITAANALAVLYSASSFECLLYLSGPSICALVIAISHIGRIRKLQKCKKESPRSKGLQLAVLALINIGLALVKVSATSPFQPQPGELRLAAFGYSLMAAGIVLICIHEKVTNVGLIVPWANFKSKDLAGKLMLSIRAMGLLLSAALVVLALVGVVHATAWVSGILGLFGLLFLLLLPWGDES